MNELETSGDALIEGEANRKELGIRETGDWCERCQALREELTKVTVEHTLNYTTLKEKIISTDLLIKKYTAKCHCDIQSKKNEDLQKSLVKYRQDCELLEARLKTTLQEAEPLKQQNERLEMTHRLHQLEVRELTEKLEASEASRRMFVSAQQVSEVKISELEELLKEAKRTTKVMESRNKKQETLMNKLQGEVDSRKAEVKEQKKVIASVSAVRDRHNTHITQLERQLTEKGLSPRAVRGRRARTAQTTQARVVRQHSDTQQVSLITHDFSSSDEDLLLNKLIQDEDSDGESFSLFKPIAHALSPLPPSPPSFEDDASEDSMDDMAEVLENALSNPHGSGQGERTTIPLYRGRGRPPRLGQGRASLPHSKQSQDEESVSKPLTGDSQGICFLKPGLSSEGLQEGLSDPEVESDDIPFQKFSHEQRVLRSDLQLSASSTSESETEYPHGDTSPRRSPRRRKSTGNTPEPEPNPQRRRTRSMSQDSSSSGELSDCVTTPQVPVTKTLKLASQRVLENASPFKEPLPVSPRKSRRRRRINCRGNLQSSSHMAEHSGLLRTRRITRSVRCPSEPDEPAEANKDGNVLVTEDIASNTERNSLYKEDTVAGAMVCIPTPTRKRTRPIDSTRTPDSLQPNSSVARTLCVENNAETPPVQTGDVKPVVDEVSEGEIKGSKTKYGALKGITRIHSGDVTTAASQKLLKSNNTQSEKLGNLTKPMIDKCPGKLVGQSCNLKLEPGKVNDSSTDSNLIVNHHPLSKTTSTGFITHTFEAEDAAESVEEPIIEKHATEETLNSELNIPVTEMSEPSAKTGSPGGGINFKDIPNIFVNMDEHGGKIEEIETGNNLTTALQETAPKQTSEKTCEQKSPLTNSPISTSSVSSHPETLVAKNLDSMDHDSTSESTSSKSKHIFTSEQRNCNVNGCPKGKMKNEALMKDKEMLENPDAAEAVRILTDLANGVSHFVDPKSVSGDNKNEVEYVQQELEAMSVESGNGSPHRAALCGTNPLLAANDGSLSFGKGSRATLRRQFSVDTHRSSSLSVMGVSLRTVFQGTKDVGYEDQKNCSDSRLTGHPASPPPEICVENIDSPASSLARGSSRETVDSNTEHPDTTIRQQDSLGFECEPAIVNEHQQQVCVVLPPCAESEGTPSPANLTDNNISGDQNSAQNSDGDGQNGVGDGQNDDGNGQNGNGDSQYDDGGTNEYNDTSAVKIVSPLRTIPASRPTSLLYRPASASTSGSVLSQAVAGTGNLPHQQSPAVIPDGGTVGWSETLNVIKAPSVASETISPMSSLPPSPMEKVECITPLSPMLPSDQSEALSPLSFTLSDTEDMGNPISPLPPSPSSMNRETDTQSYSDDRSSDQLPRSHDQLPRLNDQRPRPADQLSESVDQLPNLHDQLAKSYDQLERSPDQLEKPHDQSAGSSSQRSPFIYRTKAESPEKQNVLDFSSTEIAPPVHQPRARIAHLADEGSCARQRTVKGKATPGIPSKSSKTQCQRTVGCSSQGPPVQTRADTRKTAAVALRKKKLLRKSPSKVSVTVSEQAPKDCQQSQPEPFKSRRSRLPKRHSTNDPNGCPVTAKVQCTSSREGPQQVTSIHRDVLAMIRRRGAAIDGVVTRLLNNVSSGPLVVSAIIKVCQGQEMDLMSTLYTMCSKSSSAVWSPYVAEHEAKVTQLILQLAMVNVYKELASLFIEAATDVILDPVSASLLGKVSLCRICVSLCRQMRWPGRARVLIYDIVASQVVGFPMLTVAVACVWPELLRQTIRGTLQGPQTLVDVLQYVVMRRVSSDKVRLTKLAVCLHTLCHWSPPREGRDATSLVTSILQLLQAEADRASPNKDVLCELEQSLILVARTEDWAWTNNVLVVDSMWPRLREWAAAQARHMTSVVSHVMWESLVRLMGHIVSRCPAAHASAANDVINMMRPLVLGVPGAMIPLHIQQVALESLLRLAPFCTNAVAETTEEWLRAHPLAASTPLEGRRVVVDWGTTARVSEEQRLRDLIRDFVRVYATVLTTEDRFKNLIKLK